MPMVSGPPAGGRPVRCRPGLALRTWVLLAGSAVALVATAAAFFLYRPQAPGRYAQGDDGAWRGDWPEAASSPARGMDPLAGVMERLASPPDGAFAPSGATWISAYRHGGGVIVTYLAGEPLSAIESFYRSELPARGFKLMREGPALPGGALSLVFARPGQLLVVQLRMDKDQQVRIVLVMEALNEQT